MQRYDYLKTIGGAAKDALTVCTGWGAREAEVIHGVAHPDANIIFGAVIDDEMGDEVRVTVIAAGFDRWESDNNAPKRGRATGPSPSAEATPGADVFGSDDEELEGDDDFDVPSFLK